MAGGAGFTPHLAVPLTDGAVELALLIVTAANHGTDLAIGRHDHGGALPDLASLRAIPGVTSVAKVNQLPFRRNSSNTRLPSSSAMPTMCTTSSAG